MSRMTRLSLGRQLKKLRVDAGLTQADVLMIGSRQKINQIEGGKRRVRIPDVIAWCRICRADKQTMDRLEELAKNDTAHGWWEDFRKVLDSWFATYVEMESEAPRLLTWGTSLIHGLLQTEAYARVVMNSGPHSTPERTEHSLAIRLARQRAVFDRGEPLNLCAVMDEGCLLRQVGGPDVMAEQVAHLCELAKRPDVDVRILPWEAGAHVAMKGDFTILEFDDEEDPAVVYLEQESGARYEEDNSLIGLYQGMFASITSRSIPIKEYHR